MKKKEKSNVLTKSLVGLCLILLLGTLTLVFSDEYVPPNGDPEHNADKIYIPSDIGEIYSVQQLYDEKIVANVIQASCADKTVVKQQQIDANYDEKYATNYTYGGFTNDHQLTNCLKVRP